MSSLILGVTILLSRSSPQNEKGQPATALSVNISFPQIVDLPCFLFRASLSIPSLPAFMLLNVHGGGMTY